MRYRVTEINRNRRLDQDGGGGVTCCGIYLTQPPFLFFYRLVSLFPFCTKAINTIKSHKMKNNKLNTKCIFHIKYVLTNYGSEHLFGNYIIICTNIFTFNISYVFGINVGLQKNFLILHFFQLCIMDKFSH